MQTFTKRLIRQCSLNFNLIAKNWKQPTCPLTTAQKDIMVYSYHAILLNNKKITIDICNSIDKFPKNHGE